MTHLSQIAVLYSIALQSNSIFGCSKRQVVFAPIRLRKFWTRASKQIDFYRKHSTNYIPRGCGPQFLNKDSTT